ncbi:phosphoglycerate dehydrogenase-like enzyme [Caldalkalibacillus uzonensis]|uniref:Phosphoglycerate dehydrogenase-like enzyme n=1 Tax=Caldalkalibacillus uzonensis TaxID=353224 RepID=A0ABU0CNU8_9BACI|nr:2-hydroxyacid dehydrogenase [Caldalkalibacillus uzonensis]MDQ0338090.1 phosphoglycerate dehydrogenase-like enzyme [Caldalkalibacillus uzonensis]
MSKPSILYFDQVNDQMRALLKRLKPEGFELWFWHDLDEDERNARLPQADYLMAATYPLDQHILAKATQAKLVQKTGVGVDNIDLPKATELALPIANTPGANAPAVAELTILLILALYRKLPVLHQSMKEGKWLMWEFRSSSYEMQGKTHGLIGFGQIGQETAKRSRAFGTQIIYYDKFRAPAEVEEQLDARFVSLEELLQTADIVSLHIPLLPETRGLINAKTLQLMKKSAVLINVSRGGVVHEQALYHALKDGVIAGAGIDVWESEPVHADHPLLQLENVIASPHIGAGTIDTLKRVLATAFNNIQAAENEHHFQYSVNGITQLRTPISQ